MRIGIVTTWFERGGAYVSRQFRQALQPEHEVLIYARGGESYAQDDPRWNEPGVTWARRSLNPRPTTFALPDFKRWVQTERLDVVFFNEQHWWRPVLLCAEMGVKTGSYVDYYTEETLPLFGLYDFLICNTRRHAEAFSWHPQSHYVPWGTELDLYKPRGAVAGPVTPGVVTFFHSCGWDPHRKGTETLLRALQRVDGPWRLVLHSQVPIAADLLSDRVELHQETVPAPGLYHLGDVYVYPSRLDGLGLTMAEGLASGLPLITTDQPPMSEFVDGSNGRLVEVSRLFCRADAYYWPQAMVDEDDLVRALQESVNRLDTLGEWKTSARAYAEQHLDWTHNSASLPGIFADSSLREDSLKRKATQAAGHQDSLWRTSVGDLITSFPPLLAAAKALKKGLGLVRGERA